MAAMAASFHPAAAAPPPATPHGRSVRSPLSLWWRDRARSSSQKEDLIDLVQIIYTNSNEGKDATDWIDDKLDEYANMITSSDKALYNAFHKLRLMADERPTAQAEAALELINVLNNKSKNDYLKQNNFLLLYMCVFK
jgi:hypothetical protein